MLMMRISIILVALVLYSALFLSSCDLALAQQGATPEAKMDLSWEQLATDPGALDVGRSIIAPSSPLYFLKNLREKIELLTAGNGTIRITRQLEFSIRRIREVRSLIEVKREDLIPPTLEKYKDYIKNLNKKLSVEDDIQVKLGDGVARHIYVLQNLYHQVNSKEAKRAIVSAIQTDLDYNFNLVDKLPTKLSEQLIQSIALRQVAGCEFLETQVDSTLWNEVEREVLKERVEVCNEKLNQKFKDQLDELLKKKQSSVSPL